MSLSQLLGTLLDEPKLQHDVALHQALAQYHATPPNPRSATVPDLERFRATLHAVNFTLEDAERQEKAVVNDVKTRLRESLGLVREGIAMEKRLWQTHRIPRQVDGILTVRWPVPKHEFVEESHVEEQVDNGETVMKLTASARSEISANLAIDLCSLLNHNLGGSQGGIGQNLARHFASSTSGDAPDASRVQYASIPKSVASHAWALDELRTWCAAGNPNWPTWPSSPFDHFPVLTANLRQAVHGGSADTTLSRRQTVAAALDKWGADPHALRFAPWLRRREWHLEVSGDKARPSFDSVEVRYLPPKMLDAVRGEARKSLFIVSMAYSMIGSFFGVTGPVPRIALALPFVVGFLWFIYRSHRQAVAKAKDLARQRLDHSVQAEMRAILAQYKEEFARWIDTYHADAAAHLQQEIRSGLPRAEVAVETARDASGRTSKERIEALAALRSRCSAVSDAVEQAIQKKKKRAPAHAG